MILGALKKIISIAIKFIAMLLVAFSLWVPLIYTLIFIIVIGITGASFSDHSNLFWAGLIISFAVSLGISFYVHEKRKSQKREKRSRRKSNLDGGDRVNERGFNGQSNNMHYQMPMCPHYQHQHSNYSINNTANDYEEYDDESTSYKIYNPTKAIIEKTTEESPKIFAIKSDPSVFICEYDDRLEYYKHTRNGMILMETKRK